MAIYCKRISSRNLKLVLEQYDLLLPELMHEDVDDEFLARFCIAYVYAGVEHRTATHPVEAEVKEILVALSGSWLDPDEERFVNRVVADRVALHRQELEEGPVLG